MVCILSRREIINHFQLTASGEAGGPVVSVLRAVEADLNIRLGAVTLLLQLMGGNIVRGDLIGIFPATRKNVS